jgi:hypothetical protein
VAIKLWAETTLGAVHCIARDGLVENGTVRGSDILSVDSRSADSVDVFVFILNLGVLVGGGCSSSARSGWSLGLVCSGRSLGGILNVSLDLFRSALVLFASLLAAFA